MNIEFGLLEDSENHVLEVREGGACGTCALMILSPVCDVHVPCHLSGLLRYLQSKEEHIVHHAAVRV